MPEVIGKLPQGKVAYLSVSEDSVKVEVEKGFLGKKRIIQIEKPLTDTISTELSTGHKPYAKSRRLVIKIMTDEVEEEIVFFTRTAEKLTEIKSLIDEDIERRRSEFEKATREFHDYRNAYLNQVTLNLELVEKFLEIISQLDGIVDWRQVKATIQQAKKIENERHLISLVTAGKVPLDNLDLMIETRQIEEIKREASESIDIIFHSVAETAKHTSEWISSDYGYQFLKVLLTVWERELESITGLTDADTNERLWQSLETVRDRVEQDLVEEQELPVLESLEDLSYTRVRSTLYVYIDVLLNIPFSVQYVH
ncbi:MAG: hypothetical protein NWE89_08870 [Candidatus Bathyarchaeota archaeon]|nr:hypothetical protein [Candidatus Bathyarchaeota archaeon]